MAERFFMNESIFMLVVVASGLAMAVGMVVLIGAVRKRQTDKLGDLAIDADPLKGKSSGSGVYEGVEYKYEYIQGGKNKQPEFRVSVRCVSSGSFKVVKETGFDRFFKKWGLCVELSTGDPEFDGRFYIRSNAVNFVRAYFAVPEHRQAVGEIYDRGFRQVHHDGKSMVAVIKPFRSRERVNRRLVEEVVERLVVLSEEVPDVPETALSNWKAKRVVAFAVPALIYVTAFPALIVGLAHYRPLDFWDIVVASLTFSVPVMVVMWWLSVLLLRGRSTSHREWFIVWICSLFAYPFAGGSYAVYLNGGLDKGVETSYRVMVVGKYISESENDTDHYAMVDSWRTLGDTENIKVTESVYQEIDPNEAAMTVTTKPGRFGYEWVKGYRLEAGTKL
jgi:hypothetical protein